jgi:hypothetical protein
LPHAIQSRVSSADVSIVEISDDRFILQARLAGSGETESVQPLRLKAGFFATNDSGSISLEGREAVMVSFSRVFIHRDIKVPGLILPLRGFQINDLDILLPVDKDDLFVYQFLYLCLVRRALLKRKPGWRRTGKGKKKNSKENQNG